MLSSILDTEPMSKKDCEINADRYLQINKYVRIRHSYQKKILKSVQSNS